MTAAAADSVYLPRPAVVDRVTDEIPEVRTFHWHFEDPADQRAFRRARPGQFAQVTVYGTGEFPLSLPFAPGEDETFFTVRRVGACTDALHRLAPGDGFAVRGPYGNGFPMEAYAGKDLVFVAGGIGLIPLRACVLDALAHRERYRSILVFYGAKTPGELLYRPLLRAWTAEPGVACHLTVDRPVDGWSGHVGVVGSLFHEPGVHLDAERTVAFVCGPPVMFRFALRDLLALGVRPASVVSTLERYMKCGVGKCGHCCIGQAYVCVDGPVFTCEQIAGLGERL